MTGRWPRGDRTHPGRNRSILAEGVLRPRRARNDRTLPSAHRTLTSARWRVEMNIELTGRWDASGLDKSSQDAYWS